MFAKTLCHYKTINIFGIKINRHTLIKIEINYTFFYPANLPAGTYTYQIKCEHDIFETGKLIIIH